MIDEKVLARQEMERHRPGMLYAEKRLVDAGEFEEAAQSLLRRSRRQQIGLGVLASFLLAEELFLGRNPGFLLLCSLAAIVMGAMDQGHLKRTLETLRRLGTPAAPEHEPRVDP